MIFHKAFIRKIFRYLLIIWMVCCSGMAEAQIATHGKASYYSDKFEGRKTANGELYCKDSLTAAHRTLVFGTKVKVTNVKSNAEVIVRINDRGPHIKGRIIDLSRKSMEKLGGVHDGVIDVSIEFVVDE